MPNWLSNLEALKYENKGIFPSVVHLLALSIWPLHCQINKRTTHKKSRTAGDNRGKSGYPAMEI